MPAGRRPLSGLIFPMCSIGNSMLIVPIESGVEISAIYGSGLTGLTWPLCYLHVRWVVDWALSNRSDTSLTIKALYYDYEQRGKPEDILFHADRGSQCDSLRFRLGLWGYQIEQSMSRRVNCWDNAPMEQLFRNLKTERVPTMGYRSIVEVRKDFGLYLMDYCN